MPTRRSYADACGAAHGLDLIGDRWALLVVRELILGPKRFTDLRDGLPGISPNVLTQRLEELESANIVRRRKLPPPGGAWVYELTEWGAELEDIIKRLGRWAVRSPLRQSDLPIGTDSLMLSFRTMFDGASAAGLDASIELRIGDATFRARVARNKLTLVRGAATDPDVVITASSPNALAAIVYGGLPIADAQREGDVQVTGNKTVVKRFVSLFPLPEPIAPPPTAAASARAPTDTRPARRPAARRGGRG